MSFPNTLPFNRDSITLRHQRSMFWLLRYLHVKSIYIYALYCARTALIVLSNIDISVLFIIYLCKYIQCNDRFVSRWDESPSCQWPLLHRLKQLEPSKGCIVCCIVSVGQKQQQSNTALFQDQTFGLNVRRHCHATVERVLKVIAEIRFILTWNRVCLTNCFHVNVIAVAEHGPVS